MNKYEWIDTFYNFFRRTRPKPPSKPKDIPDTKRQLERRDDDKVKPKSGSGGPGTER